MARLKTHAKRALSYDPQTVGTVWTLCHAHVPQAQIAAFEPTCKKCLASIKWSQENERDWQARKAAQEARQEAAAPPVEPEAPAAQEPAQEPQEAAFPAACPACGNLENLCTCEAAQEAATRRYRVYLHSVNLFRGEGVNTLYDGDDEVAMYAIVSAIEVTLVVTHGTAEIEIEERFVQGRTITGRWSRWIDYQEGRRDDMGDQSQAQEEE